MKDTTPRKNRYLTVAELDELSRQTGETTHKFSNGYYEIGDDGDWYFWEY